jgi:DNA-binding transcriptional ArsR family regulator
MLIKPSTLDNIFKALADRNRRSIFEALCHGPAPVSEIAELMPITPSAVLQHVHVLEAKGLAHSDKVGRVRICRVDAEALGILQYWVESRQRDCGRAERRR